METPVAPPTTSSRRSMDEHGQAGYEDTGAHVLQSAPGEWVHLESDHQRGHRADRPGDVRTTRRRQGSVGGRTQTGGGASRPSLGHAILRCWLWSALRTGFGAPPL